jgi:hypothetical protein
MTSKGERLLAALRADTGLLFEVATALQGEKVAGPWTVTKDTSGWTRRVRLGVDGRSVVIVRRHATRKVNPWEALLARRVDDHEGSDGERPEKHFMGEGQALDWCDGQLIENGWFIAPQPGT